jgi:(5-formylfuran-3-yl)methyl phosphate synthase
MELLVSVRSGAEVAAALAGGADVIDAKEPAYGSLGPVAPEVLSEILALVPGEQPFSLALGDFVDPDAVLGAISSRRLAARSAPLYLKLGFAGVSAPARLEAMIATAVAASGGHPASPLVIVVAYADAARAGTASPDTIRLLAGECGAAGVLLDTQVKDGRGLLSWMDLSALRLWVESARHTGLLTAVAGSLQSDDIGLVSTANPDVVGVRGAACSGGRGGLVNAIRVRALRERLSSISGSVQGAEVPTAAIDGETRDPGAISPCGE